MNLPRTLCIAALAAAIPCGAAEIAYEVLPDIPAVKWCDTECGNVVKAIYLKDAAGSGVVFFADSGPQVTKQPPPPGISPESMAATASRDLQAVRYSTWPKDQRAIKLWQVHDYIHDCIASLEAEFSLKHIRVTDLDRNGLAEVWIPYSMTCHGDVSPRRLKIIMYEGSKKLAVRGEELLRIPGEVYGGRATLSAPAGTPKSIIDYAKALWKEFSGGGSVKP